MKKWSLTLVIACVFLCENHAFGQWVRTNGPCGGYVSSFGVSSTGNAVFAGTTDGIYLTTNYGKTWVAIDTDTEVSLSAVSGGAIYAGTDGGGIWRRPLSEITSTTPTHHQKSSSLQKRMCVFRHSPFGVTVSYTVRSRCPVRMELYTISGERVAVLDKGEQAPGEYSLRLAGNGSSTAGVYVYRFEAGNYRESDLVKVLK
jgi:hypothetical protein